MPGEGLRPVPHHEVAVRDTEGASNGSASPLPEHVEGPKSRRPPRISGFWGLEIDAALVTYDEISFLPEDFDPADHLEHLKEDLVQVQLPSGDIVDAGWLPEFDPTGAFHVTVVSEGDWERPRQRVTVRDVAELRRLLGVFARG